jgi:hypothetical protein
MSDDQQQVIDASPQRRFFVEMLTRDIELAPAIMDLVDNSADGAKRLRPEQGPNRYEGLSVHLELSGERFVIKDNCGGMSVELARDHAFRFGRSEDAPTVPGEVGQFGIGMKRALFKMGDRFTVESTAEASKFSLSVDVAEWAAENSPEWEFRFDEVEEGIETDEDERGTKITVEALRDLVKQDFDQELFVNRLRRQLSMRQLRLLQQGLQINVNGVDLQAPQPILLSGEEFRPIHVEKELPVNGNSLSLRLWAGLADAGGDDDDVDDAEKYRGEAPAGWYVFCNDRLLLYADKSRLTGWGAEAAAYHPQYRRFQGYVLLDGDARYMPWNTTKTGVDEDSRVFREVQNEMFDALQKVQAVINRLKKERRQGDADQRPAIEALDASEPKQLEDLSPSTSFVVPAPAPDPPATAQWIRYQVDLDDFKRVAESVDASAPSDVGRATFDWYLEEQVD